MTCKLDPVRINRNDDKPVRLTRDMGDTFNATVILFCPVQEYYLRMWYIYPVPYVGAVPDWTKPMQKPPVKVDRSATVLTILPYSFTWGVYLFNFSVVVRTRDPRVPGQKDSDSIYVVIFRRPLNAVISGPSNITINFTDGVTLNGNKSSDPEETDPLEKERLKFLWYCTTDPKDYDGQKITVISKEVCLPEQVDLKWTWASGPILTLSPETLQGGRVYFFRLVIQKTGRSAFADATLRVLQGEPVASISCIENCDQVLVLSERFSLSLDCTGCTAGRDVYRWSILTSSGQEVPFDWTGQTSTGRHGAYVSIKAFAFWSFKEDKFWISLNAATWSGVTLVLRYPFIIHHVPITIDCKIVPEKGISFITQFVVICTHFKHKNIVLTYKIIVPEVHGFGEISSVKENNFGSILYLGKNSTSPPSFLPVGVLDSHYALKIIAQAYNTSLGAFSQVNLYATVRPPTDVKSSTTVLEELSNFTTGPNSSLSALLQQQDFLNASYLIYVVASVMNSMKTDTSLQADKIKLREHLFNQTLILPINTLVNISQVVMTITKLTEKTSEISAFSQKLATVRTWQASQALQDSHQRDKSISSEQIESVCTGILTTLSNILKLLVHYEVFEEPFHVVESLADTVLAVKVPENETTALRTSNFKMHVKKTEKWNVTKFFSTQKHCQNCFYPTLNVNSVASLPANAPISTMFCEFADDPFPWLNHGENILTQVVGFRMTGVEVTGDVIEMPPDAVEVYLIRKNLSFGTFNLTVGPSSEPYAVDESLAKTTGAFSFVVDSAAGRDVLIHILTDVSVLFTVSVYAGREITPKSFMTSYLVPHKIPPIANESDLFDPECPVKEARVVCLPAALVQVIAQRTDSSECTIAVVLQAPRFVLNPNNKLVRISVFSTECLDMLGIQSDWREDTCVVGEKTTWQRVHCMCKNPRRAKRQLDIIKQANLRLRTHYLTANVIVVPNPVDLRVEAVKNVTQNPVTLFTVLLIMLLYLILAFWALHRDETDQYLREHVIVLLDNDPDDNVCYLVTVFTGSRCGSGTRANVFIQLHGTEVSSFFIIFYGLTYGFEKSTAWLFASFCAFTQSVFLVQPSKVILVSGYRTRRAKYCKNLSWIGNSRFTEIKLHNIRKDPEEMDRRHRYVMELRNSRMYQPLTQDEITIFKRKKRIKRRAFLFLSYILTHFIFLALLLSLVAVLRPTDSFYYNQFIRDQFSVDLAGVARLEDIYQWLNRVLLPLLHNDPNPTFFPDSSSKILGLPLMRQLRAQPGEITCLPAKKFVAGSLKGEIRCHPEYGIDPEDTKNYSGSWNRVSKRDTDQTAGGFTYRPPEKRWAYSSYGLLHTYGSGGYAFYFFPAEQQFNSTLRLSKLQKGHWLDEKTWSVIVELTTFNADISLLCSVSVIFEVSQLGVVNTSLHAHSFSLAHFNRKYSADSAENYLYLAIFIFFLAYTVDEVYVITQERTAYVQSVYNLLNFALKCIFTLWIVLFFRKHFLAIGVVQAYLSNPEDFIPFHAVAQVDYTMRVILGFLVFLTILKTLRYSRVFYDVRLAQRAIQIALPGICHMALVVSVYFFVFMAFGYLVFGQHEWNYSDMIHATQTIFSYCVSAFKNTEFFNNRVLGVLFLSSFLLVMICILINLFQAVILSAYEEMKQPVYEEPSEEAEAMTYLCHRLRSAFCCLCFKPRAEDEPRFFINMVYGQPEKKSRRYLGLKTRNINGKKMVYLVV
ncbi:hypothetical protein MG293_002335 [Ovis ammon polii]|uniref:REJ domain-containing protein n=1 Tax=Ovis ammon polii TaxID=230172 RepID=A0AAD4ULA6_OVIAM|nr:hypothetical protein MG293_002335 [Ovis ammon polii]